MKILAIETSCDETAISLVEAQGDFLPPNPPAGGGGGSARFEVLGNALLSQIDIHKEFGGVYPALAKREHAKNITPLLLKVLRDSGYYRERQEALNPALLIELRDLFSHEPELFKSFAEFHSAVEPVEEIDAIAVTAGPGLEPTLWVGINFAKALARTWEKPLIPVNHMEGHVISSLMQKNNGEYRVPEVKLPLLALLISGGHTELVLMKEWGKYEVVGQTRDDAVGEAFDKAARVLELPYPGGPEISRLASEARKKNLSQDIEFPRPMLRDNSLDFSFSGLKTAVLYYERDNGPLDDEAKQKVARAFEDAVVDVLREKTKNAVEHYGAQTLVIGGGVSANQTIRDEFEKTFTDIDCYIPARELTTDNALMIAGAAYLRAQQDGTSTNPANIVANGNLSL